VSDKAAPQPATPSNQPPQSPFQLWGRRLLTLAAAGAGGYAAFSLKIPLPWVLGAMMGTALVMLLGVGGRQPLQGRRAAQITIGTALGLTFTQEVIREVASLGHWMLAGAAFSIMLTMLFSRVIQRLAGIDGPTAIYSVAVGASAEMALQAQKAGADGAQVASAHAIRIILVVTLASVVAHYSGEKAGPYISAATPAIGWQLALLFVFLAPACGWLAERLRVPNAWLLGPVIMAGSFAASGVNGRMFPEALVAAQVLIGWSLGQHMTRQFFIKSPRMLASAAAVTLSMLAICVLLAWGLSKTGVITLLTAFLAVAPGGTAEMAIIAKTFGIGAPIVTAFHFFRVISTVLSIRWVFKFLVRTGWVHDKPFGSAP
jgi:membrane AbrB-like protein